MFAEKYDDCVVKKTVHTTLGKQSCQRAYNIMKDIDVNPTYLERPLDRTRKAYCIVEFSLVINILKVTDFSHPLIWKLG